MYRIVAALLLSLFVNFGTSYAADKPGGIGGTTTVQRYPHLTLLAAVPSSPSVVYGYATDYEPGDIYKSGNGGSSWSKIASFPYSGYTVKSMVAGGSAGELYILTSNGLFRSRDDGASWATIVDSYPVTAIAIDPAHPSTIYAGATGLGLLKSTDDGNNWSVSGTGMTSSDINSVLISASSSSVVYAATPAGIFKSSDGGEAWSNSGEGLPSAAVTDLQQSRLDSSTLYAATAAGFYKSADAGANWVQQSATVVGHVSVLAGSTDTLIADGRKSTDSGVTWDYLSYTALATAWPSTLYAYSTDLGAEASTDSGSTWSIYTAGLPQHSERIGGGGSQKTGLPVIGLHILSDTGSGVAGALVSCNGTQVVSDTNGYAIFYGVPACTAQISARGYLSTSVYAPVISLGYQPFTSVTLAPNQLVVSTASDSNGTIAPASVTVTGPQRATLTVTPNAGYKIQNVSGCGGFLNGTTFTTAPISSACTVSATFAQAATYSVAPVSGGHGTISPSTTQTVPAGGSTSFAVTAADGYQIMSVTGCGGTLTGNSYTTAALTGNCTVSAAFGRLVTFTPAPNGTLTGSTSQVVADGGSSSAVTAVPNTGYDFVNWTGTGGFVTSTSNPLTVSNVLAAQDVTANFAIKTFTVTPTVPAGGSITPGIPQTVEYNSTKSFTMAAAPGFRLTSVTGCGGTLSGDLYTIAAATGDCAISATFSPVIVFAAGPNGSITGSTTQVIPGGGSSSAVEAVPATGFKFVNWTGTGGLVSAMNPLILDNVMAGQTVTANFAVQTFAVTAAPMLHGALAPRGVQTVDYNTFVNFNIEPDATYTVQSITGCGGSYHDGIYSTGRILADCTITATFGHPVSFAASNGTLTGNVSQVVTDGGSTSAVTAVANTGYRFVKWTGFDGFESTDNPLTLTGVTAPQAVTANFAVQTFSVQPTASSDGQLSPAAPVTVNYGSSASFTVTPKDGYKLLLPVGGTCPAGSVSEAGYSTGPITADCTVHASFTPTAHVALPGDCDNSGTVSIAEVQSAINMFLGLKAVQDCVDLDRSAVASISEVQRSINGFLGLETSSPLLSIAVDPGNPTVAQGGNQQLRAIGTYADSTTQDVTLLASWRSSVPSVAELVGASAPGKAHGVSAGNSVITASYGGTSGNSTLTVSPAVLVSLAVQPSGVSAPLGTHRPFTAIGRYSDNSTQDLTYQVSWSSSAPGVADFNVPGATGAVAASAPGTATVTATFAGISGSGTITVTPAALVSIAVTAPIGSAPVGRAEQYSATGTYTDFSTRDITSSVSWTSSDTSVATISNQPGSNGKATAIATGGPVVVTASLDGITGIATFVANRPALVSLVLSPQTVTLGPNESRQFTATGTYTDGTTRDLTGLATWFSSSPGIVDFYGSGVAVAGAAGTATVTVVYSLLDYASATATVTVLPSLRTLAISPVNTVVPLGTVVQCSAVGTYSDSSAKNLTSSVSWSSSAPGVASPGSTAGSFNTSGVGTTTITGTSGSVSDSTSLTVVGNFRGTWSGSWSSPPFGGCGAGSGSISFGMNQSGAQVSAGAFGLPWIGTVSGSTAQMQVNCCNYQRSTWTVSGNTLTGTVPVTCGSSEYMAPFTVTRQ